MNPSGKRKCFMGRLVEISFVDVEVARTCNDDDLRVRRYGPALAAVLRRRLAEIDAAAHLADLARLPAARLRAHPDDLHLLLVSLGPTADLHLRPRAAPLPHQPDGTLHFTDVRAVLVTDIQLAPAASTSRPALLRARREAS
jgi:plasmid maintenance system killer protein